MTILITAEAEEECKQKHLCVLSGDLNGSRAIFRVCSGSWTAGASG